MSTSVAELVAMMGGVQGIDWEALERRGKNSIFDAEYIMEYVLPAYGRALDVFNTLDFKPENDEELVQIYLHMNSDIKEPLEFAKKAFQSGLAALLPGQGLGMTDAEMRSFIYYIWLTVTNGAYMHHKVLIHYAVAKNEGGQLSDAGVQRIADHANWVVTMCNTVVKLNSMGAFKAIKKPGFSGTPYVYNAALGVLPVAAIVILGIALIAGIAYLLLGVTEVTAREATVYRTCRDAAEGGDAEALQLCRDLSKSTPSPSGDLATTVMIVAAVAAAGYALIAFGPSIAQSLKQALEKKEKAATAA